MAVATLLTKALSIFRHTLVVSSVCFLRDLKSREESLPKFRWPGRNPGVLELRALGFRVMELATPPRSLAEVQIWTLNRVKSCLLKLKAFNQRSDVPSGQITVHSYRSSF